MSLTIIGAHPFEHDERGALKSRIATIFPRRRVLVTLPGIHAWQRAEFLGWLAQRRAEAGLPPLSDVEQSAECEHSVDLILETDAILIRPDPERMDLAFEADDALQELVSKQQVRFLYVRYEAVQQAIRERGEFWRISPLPRSKEEMRSLVQESKVAILEQPIYYYNRGTGTRYVTWQEFSGLQRLPAAERARQLQEIAHHARTLNRAGHPEVDFFAVNRTRFGAEHFAGINFEQLSEARLAEEYARLRAAFEHAVPVELRRDDPNLKVWCNRMYSALVGPRTETMAEELLLGLSPEFFLQIEWLPGGRFEEGEFVFDPVLDEAEAKPDDPALARLCDEKAEGFISNFIREYGDLEYVNVGRIWSSLSQRPQKEGRRDVYIAELKLRGARERLVRFIRLQKWGIREHLNEAKGLLQSIRESDEYTDYILDRRLGCRQLGMNLPARVTMRRVKERYTGANPEVRGQDIYATYFERDYVAGIATDKLPACKYEEEAYALGLARLLGKAAASNLVAGRGDDETQRVVFDDGDEVLAEDSTGLPQEIIVGDHSGAFSLYRESLEFFADQYARPVNSRAKFVPNLRAFAEAYLAAFLEQFLHVQGDYRKRRRAFDHLFKHCKYDEGGSFAFRWKRTLERLDATDAPALTQALRKHIPALNDGKSA